MLELLELVTGGKVRFEQYGDNQSTCTIIRSGVNSTMRHFGRQHGIDLAFLHGHCESGTMSLDYVVTDRQCGDIFTKHCTDNAKWSRLLPQIGHFQMHSAPAPWVPKKKPQEQLAMAAGGLRAHRKEIKEINKNLCASRSLQAPHRGSLN